jgi:hypothetical protein
MKHVSGFAEVTVIAPGTAEVKLGGLAGSGAKPAQKFKI